MPVQKTAKKRRTIPLRDLPAIVTSYVDAKKAASQFEGRRTALRDQLIEIFHADGEVDPDGHEWLDLPENIQDSKGRLVNRIKLQRAKQERLKDDETVSEMLDKLGLLEQCQVTQVMLSEEKILNLHAAGDISEKQLNEMYSVKFIWSLAQL